MSSSVTAGDTQTSVPILIYFPIDKRAKINLQHPAGLSRVLLFTVKIVLTAQTSDNCKEQELQSTHEK